VTNVPDNPELLSSVASSISDGALIEWDQVAQQAAGDEDGVLDELRLLERIAKFHQTAQENGVADAADAGGQPAEPRAWAHFLILGRIGGGSFGLGYARRREWLICPKCHRSAIFDVKRGTRN